MKYRLKKIDPETLPEYAVPNGQVVKGPIENLLVVTFPNEVLHHMMMARKGRPQEWVASIKRTLFQAGWKGEVMICGDEMKFARFEPVEEERPKEPELPSLPEVEAEQSRAVQELRDEDDQRIIADVKRALGQ